jgi:Mn2+/Fe2+ NRAMP family transporter
MLWVALFTFPLMAAVQEICDRTALATGKGLGELIVVRFGKTSRGLIGVLLGLLIVANALNIAADLVAIGAGMRLLHAGPEALWALIAGALLITLVFTGSFELTARVLKIFCLALLAYIVVLFTIKVPWVSVIVHTIVPHFEFSKGFIALLIAVLGTTISPYLFFWQSMHRIEDMREERAGGDQPKALTRRSRVAAAKKQSTSRFDVFSGMGISNLVMFAIIVATAVTLDFEAGRGPHGVVYFRLRIHRFGNVGDSRLGGIGRGRSLGNARQTHRLLAFTATSAVVLRPLHRGNWWRHDAEFAFGESHHAPCVRGSD